MEQAEIAGRVAEQFGERLRVQDSHRGQHFVTVSPGDLREVVAWLRDEGDLDFDVLMDIGGVDYLDYGDDRAWRFEVVYQMYSSSKNHRFRVKVAVESDAVEVPSLWDSWGVANWMEREVFDLFGVRFSDHPNLRRILCHDDFQGHALRKDYPINKRQKLTRPVENLLTEKPEWA